MKLLHTSDWHIGRSLFEFSLLDDQREIFEQICSIVRSEQVDAVLISGDLYDRSLPSADAVQLLDHIFTTLTEQIGVPVLAISGNHDSPERLSFGGRLMGGSGIHIAPAYGGHVEPFVLQDEFGPVSLYLLPFVKPALVRRFFPDQEIESYTDAVRAALEEMEVDPAERNVLVTHQCHRGQPQRF